MLKAAIAQVVGGKDLSRQEAAEVMRQIMEGMATDAQIASLITALRMKGETVEEITGFTQVMREKAERVLLKPLCWIPAEPAGMAPIPSMSRTAAALAGATGGGAVRGQAWKPSPMSSKCGSADVLEALRRRYYHSTHRLWRRCLQDAGIGFFFAPLWHKSMKYAIGPRKEIGIRTVFNVLGPMTNPAGANANCWESIARHSSIPWPMS